MEEATKKKRGYLSKHVNYYDWFVSHDTKWQREHMPKCQHCGQKFIPTAPNQKYCGPDNKSCFEARHDPKLADGQWLKNMTSDVLVPYHERTNS